MGRSRSLDKSKNTPWKEEGGSYHVGSTQAASKYYDVESTEGRAMLNTVNTVDTRHLITWTSHRFFSIRGDSSELKELGVDADTPLGTSLPSGVYIYEEGTHRTPSRLTSQAISRRDEVIHLDVYDKVIDNIKGFISNRKIYDKLSIAYRRGILLYGPPGTSKSMCIRYLLSKVVPKDSIAIFMSEPVDSKILQSLEDDKRLKIFIAEELVNFLDCTYNFQWLLEFLDGYSSMENALILSSTNYPEKLPSNLADRPSRFDLIHEMNQLSAKDTVRIFEAMGMDFNKLASSTVALVRSMSIPLIRECILYSKVHNKPIDRAIFEISEQEKHNARKFKGDNDRFATDEALSKYTI